MSRYIFIGTEKDLIDNGFYDKETTLNKKISNRHVIIFDKNILVENENILSEIGVEDFIVKMIYKNFTNSEDTFLNLDWLDVEVKTHTKKTFSIENNNGIYNFRTFITNCFQNYNIVQDFTYENGRIKLTIYKQENEIILVDCTTDDISDYEEQYKTSITAKVTVKTDTNIQKWYLLSDRTTTQDMNNENRVKGKEELVYTSKSEDAYQTAMDKFKSNSYEHMITFKINRNSKIIDVSKLKIGTPISIKTKNNIILDSYISAIIDNGGNFIEFTSGNIRIKFIDKISQERNKSK